MGVKQIIVAVNKMDHPSVNYSQDRYNEIKGEVGDFLNSNGYKKDNIQFVPISGWTGDNLIEKSDKMPWYAGPTLTGALDSLESPKRLVNKPLRFTVQSIKTIKSIGKILIGRVQTGVLKPGMILLSAPTGIAAEVKSIEMHYESVEQAFSGDIVGVSLKGVYDYTKLKRGEVFGEAYKNPPKSVLEFTA